MSWIKFGDLSLWHLLLGIYGCENIARDQEWFIKWEDDGKCYKLERCLNNARSFIQCSVRDLRENWFCLCIPEGKGLMRGCKLLAEKLRMEWVSRRGLWKKSQKRKDN